MCIKLNVVVHQPPQSSPIHHDGLPSPIYPEASTHRVYRLTILYSHAIITIVIVPGYCVRFQSLFTALDDALVHTRIWLAVVYIIYHDRRV